jgi:hypothetical protein
MIEGGLPKPCDDCPALKRDDSFHVEDGETAIYEAYGRYRMVTVYNNGGEAGFTDEDITASPVAISIEDCLGPMRVEEEQRRCGLAGFVGLRKTVTTIWCPGLNTTKVIEE